jgi:hypothetical protein
MREETVATFVVVAGGERWVATMQEDDEQEGGWLVACDGGK